MSELEKQLNEVNAAITTILSGGQSYKIGTRSLTRADLSTLYARQKELQESISNGNGMLGRTAAAVFDRR